MTTKLSDYMPDDSPTVQAIYAHYKKVGDAEGHRGYLGASEIGHECKRYLWYRFRNCVKRNTPGRMYRLWQTGSREELRLTQDLCDIGCEVHVADEAGNQYSFSEFGGHFAGHCDGVARGIPEAPKTWHLVEYKTYNAKSFRYLKKHGLQKSQPKYAAQMQIYMHFGGLTRGLHLGKNKDTDELYSERLQYDKKQAESLIEKAQRIISVYHPPERIGHAKERVPCIYCDAREICWGVHEPLGAGPSSSMDVLPLPCIDCRQCCHATPLLAEQDATWKCESGGHSWTRHETSDPCKLHLALPGLITFAEPVDHKETEHGEYNIYRNEDGKVWEQGYGPGQYSTERLTGMKIEEIKHNGASRVGM